jgi:hypothetical protein
MCLDKVLSRQRRQMASKREVSNTPRWVKGFLWTGLATVIVVGVMLASGHGPWQHMNMAGMHQP